MTKYQLDLLINYINMKSRSFTAGEFSARLLGEDMARVLSLLEESVDG